MLERSRGEAGTPSLLRDQRLHELLAAALDRPEAEREAFLSGIEAEPELVDRVRSLLARTAAELTPAPWLADPDVIGPYRVVSLLGEGGMGRVYLARQSEPVERLVAVKLMQRVLFSGSALTRFEAERQAMARFSHPVIAQLYEAGTTEEGVPFFAMEWVDGPAITTYCDRHRLSLEERIRLLVKVCRGVEHAHQRQVLHRDLKPSNLLVAEVDGQPLPKIIDFGIAKSLDEPLAALTQASNQPFVGTPAYMSPEALGLEDGGVDTRSDVFSLGMVLYQLLAGVNPREESASVGELLRQRLDQPAPRPSARLWDLEVARRAEIAACRRESIDTLPRRLARDLDWIVMKALAADREQRYGSAAALADDLVRFLEHRAIEARPPSATYLLHKLVRRHRVAVAAAAVALVATLGGVSGATVGLIKARRAERRAVAEARATAQARDEAEEVAKFLIGLFEDIAPGAASNRELTPAAELTAREILERGARRVSNELGDRPLIRARLNSAIGEVHSHLGLYAEAQVEQERALALRRERLPAGHPDIAASLVALARTLISLHLPEEAEEKLEEALRLYADLADRKAEAATALFELGDLTFSRGRLGEATELLQRALAQAEEAVGPDSLAAARPLNSLGSVYFSAGRLDLAEEVYRRALGIYAREVPAGHPNLAQLRNNLASVLASAGRFEEAAPLFEETLAERRRLLGENHPDVAESLNNLGVLRQDQGQLAEAERFHREALVVRERVFGDSHPLSAWSRDNLAGVVADLGRLAEAETLQLEALAIRCGKLGREHPETARSLHQLGRLADSRGEPRRAYLLFRQALAIRERVLDPGARALQSTRDRLEVVRSHLSLTAAQWARLDAEAEAADPCAGSGQQ